MISAVVPVFNEAACVRSTLEAVAGFLRPRFDAFEIVVVDDGSRDRTAAEVAAVAGSVNATLLENGVNLGKGAAVRRGMLHASGDPVFFTDADLSTPLEELLNFLPHLALAEGGSGCDVVIGTRKHAAARILAAQSPLRTKMGLGYTRLVNGLLGLDFSDYTCGFKCFRREAARAIFSRSAVDGWSFDAEILFLARRLGLKVKEVPVAWRDNPDSKVRLVRDTARSFAELLSIRVRAARGGYDGFGLH
jgi:dolichyl-phosphate beta-glucosyltransferase